MSGGSLIVNGVCSQSTPHVDCLVVGGLLMLSKHLAEVLLLIILLRFTDGEQV
jgi:hypothetical protein